ncbi:MAG: hypothetical protein GY737_27390 [Desulfobacteraceae bacterium]|nr:hypothetical protein [Desulfobacteraceae bacterium]
MKKLIAMTLVTGILLSVAVVPGHAGSRERHLVEGIIIGTGAVILGAAIADEIRGDVGVCVVKKRKHYRHRNKHRNWHPRHRRHGRVKWVWVEPIYGLRWNPGHYNRRGYWVQGRQEKVIVRDGFWEKRRKRDRRRRPY